MLENLGYVLERGGKYDEAEAMQREALRIRTKVLGPSHVDTAASLHNLAVVLSHHGNLSEVEKLHREVLQQYRKSYGNEHPSVAAALANLAETLRREGKQLAEAEARAREGLDSRKKLWDAD